MHGDPVLAAACFAPLIAVMAGRRRAPRCGQPDESRGGLVGGMLSHKGGETWEGKPRVA